MFGGKSAIMADPLTAAGIAFNPFLKRIAQRSADRLFDESIEKLKNNGKISEEESDFVRDSVQILVDFETSYKYHIELREEPDIEGFKEELEHIAREAAELMFVAEMKGYIPEPPADPDASPEELKDRREDVSAAVEGIASAIKSFAEECTESVDTVENKQQIENMYDNITLSRTVISLLGSSN